MLAKALVILVLTNPAITSVLEFAEYDSEQNSSTSEVLERPMESKLESMYKLRNKK